MVLIGSHTDWRENGMYCTEPPVVLLMDSEDVAYEYYEALMGLDIDGNDFVDEDYDYDYDFPDREEKELSELLKYEPQRR